MRAVPLLLALPAVALLAGVALVLLGLGIAREVAPWHAAVVIPGLVVVPVFGLWSLFGRGPASGPVAAWAWAVVLIALLPAYFPGEVDDALITGFAAAASPGGRGATRDAARLGEQVVSPLDRLGGRRPPQEALRAADCPPPSAAALQGDQVALPYEGTGHSLAIPVLFGDVELQMLFDTGATVTTLDTASLRRLGVVVPSDAPVITLRTANGERTSALVHVPKVWVGGLLVEGVTVGVCDECAADGVSGLLGLNVSSQFLVTVDTVRKEVVFQAREGAAERLIDIGPWLDVRATATRYPDTRVDVRVEAENHAPRSVAEAVVGVTCGDDRFVVRLGEIAPGAHVEEEVRIPRGTDCDPYRVRLDSARW